MKTAVVLLNYNDAEATIAAARRIEGFSSVDCIIVLDNASTDDSLERLKAEFAPRVTKVYLLKNKKNGGYGYGNNRGVHFAAEHCGAEFVLIANPDAVFSEALVRDMREALIKDPEVGAVGAVMSEAISGKNSAAGDSSMMPDSTAAESGGMTANEAAAGHGTPKAHDAARAANISYDEFLRSGWCERDFKHELIASGPILKRLFKDKINFSEKYYSFNSPLIPVYAVHGSLLMVRADAFLRCGGYDEDMFLYMEEYALGAKLKKAGYKTMLLAGTYEHEGSHSISGAGHGAVKRQKFRQASERIYYKKYLGAGKCDMILARLVQMAVLLETYLFMR